MEYYKTMKADALRPNRGRSAFAGTTKVAVFNAEGEIFAVKNFCPHAGAALAPGKMDGPVVECPRHKWRFNVETGSCLTNPMFEVRRYPVKIEDGYIWVGIEG